MLNGSFFTDENIFHSTTEMSFPVKGAGALVSRGKEYQSTLNKWVLKIDGSEARIQPYTLRTSDFDAVSRALADARLAVVGQTRYLGSADAAKRTFAGIRDLNGDGKAEVVVFLVSTRATADEMNSVLDGSFAVKQAMAFDGGDSSQLQCINGSKVLAEKAPRSVPQVFEVFKAP